MRFLREQILGSFTLTSLMGHLFLKKETWVNREKVDPKENFQLYVLED